MCPSNTSMCTLTGVVALLPAGYSVEVFAGLTLVDCVLTGGLCEDRACRNGQFSVLVHGGNVTLRNTTIWAASLNLTLAGSGARLLIDNTSRIQADGMGPKPSGSGLDPGEGEMGTGGGHGGSAAYVYACRPGAPTSQSGRGFGYGSLAAPFEFGGASSGFSEGLRSVTRGGGRLWLSVPSGSLQLNGFLSADGSAGLHEPSCGGGGSLCGPGGGGGGSIYLQAWTLALAPSVAEAAGEEGAGLGGGSWEDGSPLISAVGGDSADTGGGGGGVVAIIAGDALLGQSLTFFNVTGGICTAEDGITCPVGGTGLVYIALGDISALAGDASRRTGAQRAVEEGEPRSAGAHARAPPASLGCGAAASAAAALGGGQPQQQQPQPQQQQRPALVGRQPPSLRADVPSRLAAARVALSRCEALRRAGRRGGGASEAEVSARELCEAQLPAAAEVVRRWGSGAGGG